MSLTSRTPRFRLLASALACAALGSGASACSAAATDDAANGTASASETAGAQSTTPPDAPDAGEDAGTSCQIPGRFVVQGGVVADNGDATDPPVSWERDVPSASYDYREAVAYCTSLDLDGTGWRLPTPTELVSLLVKPLGLGGSVTPACIPAIDQVAFPNTPADDFWTSMTQPDLDDATYTDFRDGRTHPGSPDTSMSVRCVRSVAPATP